MQRFVRRFGRVEYDLQFAIAVAEINENDAAVIATAIDPATRCDSLADMCLTEFAAGMGPKHSQNPLAKSDPGIATGNGRFRSDPVHWSGFYSADWLAAREPGFRENPRKSDRATE